MPRRDVVHPSLPEMLTHNCRMEPLAGIRTEEVRPITHAVRLRVGVPGRRQPEPHERHHEAA